jgi:3-deoxy-D-manno-octulosonic-acid transferase
MPNMKFEELGAPVAPVNNAPAGAPFMLLASVRRQEEKLLRPILDPLLRAAGAVLPGASLVIAPRHMERVPAWRAMLEKSGRPPVLRSDLEREAVLPPASLIVWDRFGELSALYAAAGAVFVGGSLAPLGGQNFLEPLAAGRIPCIGPFWSNFSWAGECASLGLVRQVADAAELAAVLPAMLQRQDRDRVREDFAAFIARKQGGSRAAAALVLETIGK